MNKIIFFDFDGVVKESLEVKTSAFVNLFSSYSLGMAERVKEHHLNNGGMSRFEKIPLYLSWAGIAATDELVNEYCEKFRHLAFQGVIDASWVPGVVDYIEKQSQTNTLVIVSATPQEELESIIASLDLTKYFKEIYGAPMKKKEAIKITLEKYHASPEDCVMFGDARADFDAAEYNHVPFILRRHTTNGQVFENYSGKEINDFTAI